MQRKPVCLAMIVRNEEPTLARSLASTLPYCDYAVIVDTGSTDATVDIARRELERARLTDWSLVRHEWQDFATNRNRSLDLARALLKTQGVFDSGYILVVDADETLHGPLLLPELELDAYLIERRMGPTHWHTLHVFKASVTWRYEGVLHEYLTCDCGVAHEIAKLEGYHVQCHQDGCRSRDPEKYRRDVQVLLEEWEREPTEHVAFYLAQSYRDLGDHDEALRWYLCRSERWPGNDEQRWHALFQAALILDKHRNSDDALRAYRAAWKCRPQRAEPLVMMASRLRRIGRVHEAYLVAQQAAWMLKPESELCFMADGVYDWMAKDELSCLAGHVGKHREAAELCRELLDEGYLPVDHRSRVRRNLEEAERAMREMAS